MKNCAQCHQGLPLTDFYSSATSKDGLTRICKACTKAKVRAWAAANPEKVKLQAKTYYLENKGLVKARARKWAKANHERRVLIVQKSAQKHIEKKRESGRAYHQAQRQKDLEAARAGYRRSAAVRRTRVAGNGGFISKAEWLALMQLFETNVCLYCGDTNGKMVMDHFVPVKLGGKTEAGNLLPCCFTCNAQKRDAPPQDWVRSRYGDEAYGEICWFLDFTATAFRNITAEVEEIFREEGRRRA
mgnify:CR=1 FL=1